MLPTLGRRLGDERSFFALEPLRLSFPGDFEPRGVVSGWPPLTHKNDAYGHGPSGGDPNSGELLPPPRVPPHPFTLFCSCVRVDG